MAGGASLSLLVDAPNHHRSGDGCHLGRALSGIYPPRLRSSIEMGLPIPWPFAPPSLVTSGNLGEPKASRMIPSIARHSIFVEAFVEDESYGAVFSLAAEASWSGTKRWRRWTSRCLEGACAFQRRKMRVRQ